MLSKGHPDYVKLCDEVEESFLEIEVEEEESENQVTNAISNNGTLPLNQTATTIVAQKLSNKSSSPSLNSTSSLAHINIFPGNVSSLAKHKKHHHKH